MGKKPSVHDLMSAVLDGQVDLGTKVDGLRKDFSDFKVQEAATNATQTADIETLKKGVSGAFREINTHKESHSGFALRLLLGVAAIVGVIMSAAGFLTYFTNAARAAVG